ncbi:hypothetical protein BJ165DRAFT_1327683, partial [Panaeolus papilionaceus]
VMSNRSTALDVCYSVYGENSVAGEFIDSYYDANAGMIGIEIVFITLTDCQSSNPFVTATSRSIIGDIHRLSHQLSSLDIPRPLAMLCTLFRLRPPRNVDDNDYLFQALRIWTDVADICENESFDGNRKVIVEHTLNILLFPGIHCEGPTSHTIRFSGESMSSSLNSPVFPTPQFLAPSLPIPGTSLSFPSPFHCKLRIVTRLSFNEQGLVTHHRDIWDVKDVMGLVPGVALGQWIGTRIAAVGLSYISRLMP